MIKPILFINVRGCESCGGNHDMNFAAIQYKLPDRVVISPVYRAVCPTTGDEIECEVTPDKDDAYWDDPLYSILLEKCTCGEYNDLETFSGNHNSGCPYREYLNEVTMLEVIPDVTRAVS